MFKGLFDSLSIYFYGFRNLYFEYTNEDGPFLNSEIFIMDGGGGWNHFSTFSLVILKSKLVKILVFTYAYIIFFLNHILVGFQILNKMGVWMKNSEPPTTMDFLEISLKVFFKKGIPESFFTK